MATELFLSIACVLLVVWFVLFRDRPFGTGRAGGDVLNAGEKEAGGKEDEGDDEGAGDDEDDDDGGDAED